LTLGKIIKIVAKIVKAKIYQIQFRLRLRPRPRWGSLQHSPDPLAGLRGPTSKGRGRDGKGRGGGGEESVREEGEPRGREGTRPHPFTPPNPYFWIRP